MTRDSGTYMRRLIKEMPIASPGDTTRERDAIERALHGWNSARAEREQIQLAPWRWETHAIPELGGTAQDIIDRQAVETCDVRLKTIP